MQIFAIEIIIYFFLIKYPPTNALGIPVIIKVIGYQCGGSCHMAIVPRQPNIKPKMQKTIACLIGLLGANLTAIQLPTITKMFLYKITNKINANELFAKGNFIIPFFSNRTSVIIDKANTAIIPNSIAPML